MVDLDKVGVSLVGHKYTALFDKISNKHRRDIADQFSVISGKTTTEAEFRGILQQELGDDPFVKWRYVYEASSNQFLDIQLLNRVTDAIGKCAERALPRT